MKLIGQIYVIAVLTTFCFIQKGWTKSEPEAIAACIDQFFEGMKAGDSTVVRQTLYHLDQVTFRTVQVKEGLSAIQSGEVQKFLTAIGTPHEEVWEERLLSKNIQIDGAMATVWAPYHFYHGGVFSHCGVNVFQLLKTPKGWKIFQITDTRRKTDCPG